MVLIVPLLCSVVLSRFEEFEKKFCSSLFLSTKIWRKLRFNHNSHSSTSMTGIRILLDLRADIFRVSNNSSRLRRRKSLNLNKSPFPPHLRKKSEFNLHFNRPRLLSVERNSKRTRHGGIKKQLMYNKHREMIQCNLPLLSCANVSLCLPKAANLRQICFQAIALNTDVSALAQDSSWE